MNKSDENLNSAPTGQFRSSQAVIAIGSVVLAAFLMIVLTALCYLILPTPEIAKQLSEQIWEMIKSAGTGATWIGAGGLAVRGLMLTQGKIKNKIEENKAVQQQKFTDEIPADRLDVIGNSSPLPVAWPHNANRDEFEQNDNIEEVVNDADY